jgi:hypothetical protein
MVDPSLLEDLAKSLRTPGLAAPGRVYTAREEAIYEGSAGWLGGANKLASTVLPMRAPCQVGKTRVDRRLDELPVPQERRASRPEPGDPSRPSRSPR